VLAPAIHPLANHRLICCLSLSSSFARYDFSVLLALLLINGNVAYFEEAKAANDIDELRKTLSNVTLVRRAGMSDAEIEAKFLVPGDMCVIRLGDIIPADCRMLDKQTAQCDQSMITGESLPVTKVRGDFLFSGSVLTRGDDVVCMVSEYPSFAAHSTLHAPSKPPL